MYNDAENSRSACFDWHNFIRTGIKIPNIAAYFLLFGLALFVKFLILTCLLQKISSYLHVSRQSIPTVAITAYAYYIGPSVMTDIS